MKYMWYVYILVCEDETLRKRGFRKLSLYTGITNNLEERLIEHKNGRGARYTRSHKPVEVVYQEEVQTHSSALKRESEIKTMSRKEKLALCKQRNNGGKTGKGH